MTSRGSRRCLALGIALSFTNLGFAQAKWRAKDVQWEKDGKTNLEVTYNYNTDGSLKGYVANGVVTDIEHPDSGTRIDTNSKGKTIFVLDSVGRAIQTQIYDKKGKVKATYYSQYDESQDGVLKVSTKIEDLGGSQVPVKEAKINYGARGEVISVNDKIFDRKSATPIIKKSSLRRWTYDNYGDTALSFMIDSKHSVHTSRYLWQASPAKLVLKRDTDGDGSEETTITYTFEEGPCNVPPDPGSVIYSIADNCRESIQGI